MGLILAGVFLAAFVINVAWGSVEGNPILGVVAEMLLLLAASVAFVTDVLKREAARKRQSQQNQ